MTDKLTPGSSPLRGPLNTFAWNRVVESSDNYHDRQARGVAAPYRPQWTRNWHTVAQARNITGGGLRQGEVVEFYGSPLNEANNDSIWMNGVTPDLSNVGWGITLDAIPHNAEQPEFGPVLVVGTCSAHVLITNNNHAYATRVSGSNVLQSADSGPVKILVKPSGSVPSERFCFVQLMDERETGTLVEVHHSGITDGRIVEANESGYHPARLRSPNGTTTYSIGAEVWLQFAEGHDGYPNDDGQILAVQGEYYGPAIRVGTWGESVNERPLYICICDERTFLGVTSGPILEGDTGTLGLLHSSTFTAAEITKTARALQNLPPNSLVKISRVAGVWVAELLAKTLVHFELIEELKITGEGSAHAKAKILSWTGSAWAAAEEPIEIEVYDWFPGMWNGLAGYRGWAEYRPTQYNDPGEDEEDEEDDELRPVYEIIWMERPAQIIRFTSTGPMDGDELPVAVNYFDWQGRDPGSTITVHDPASAFPDVHSGADGVAYYNNKERRYEILWAQRVFMRGYATLTEDCCGSLTATITDFNGEACGEFVGALEDDPTSAANPSGQAGLTGSRVELERISNTMPNPAWKIVSIERTVVAVITDLRLDGENLQYQTTDVYVQRCSTTPNPEWVTWHEAGEECEEEEEP